MTDGFLIQSPHLRYRHDGNHAPLLEPVLTDY